MAVLKYKDYYGEYEYEPDCDCWRGKILYLKEVVPFESNTLIGLKMAFENAVDDYLRKNIPMPTAIDVENGGFTEDKKDEVVL